MFEHSAPPRHACRSAPTLQRPGLLPFLRAASAPGLALPVGGIEESDPMAQMAQADAADADLLRLVLCAAGATLALALATALL